MIAILMLLSVIFPVGAWAHEGEAHCNPGSLSGKILQFYNDLTKGEHQKLYHSAFEAMNLDPDDFKRLICDYLKPDGGSQKSTVSVQIPPSCKTKFVTKEPKRIIEHIQQKTGIYLDNGKRVRFCQEAQRAYEKVYEANDH